MAIKFVILPSFFEVDTEEQEEDLQEFIKEKFPDLHPYIKYLVLFFNAHLF